MRLPALLIAVSVAAGVLAAPWIAVHLPQVLLLSLGLAAICIITGFVFVRLRRSPAAWIAGLLAWLCLGAASAQFQRLAVPPNQVSTLAARSELDLESPLRWRGILRSDPLRLPWGIRYDLDLERVQAAGEWRDIRGGLRVTYFFDQRANGNPANVRAGDRVEVLARARLARNFGDPGAFDYRGALQQQGIDLTATLRNPALMQTLPGPRPKLSHFAARLRGKLLNDLDAMLSPDQDGTAIARAMLLGDRSFLDSKEAEPFRKTGAFHVLVVAGLHVGVLAAFLFWGGKKMRLPLSARAIVTIAALCLYLSIVEDRPPITRAALMAIIYLLARVLYRRVALLNAVSLAAVAILLFRPSEITQASFQLSFLAAAIIAAVAEPLLERNTEPYRRALNHLGDITRDASHNPRAAEFRIDLRLISKRVRNLLPAKLAGHSDGFVAFPCRFALRLWELAVISVALQIGMLPLMARDFHLVSFVAPVANIPAVLLTGIIVPFGFACLAIDAFWNGLAILLGRALGLLIHALEMVIGWFARLHWASLRVPSPPTALLMGFFAAAVFVSAAILKNQRWPLRLGLATVLALAAVIILYPFQPQFQRGRLELTVLDVGQGDSIFVSFPNGSTMLVDAGGIPGAGYVRGMRPALDIGEEVVSPFLWSRGLKRIDTLVVTHGHEDHIGGMPAVLKNFEIGEIWVGRDEDAPAYHNLIAAAKAQGIPVAHRLRGEHFNRAGVDIRVLWPDSSDAGRARNDDSLVLRLEDGKDSFLLTGDIERAVEHSIVGEGDVLAATFLKIPHHGGKTSSSEQFLDAVHPAFAAISVGEANPFGHPSPDTISRIAAEGARLFRTDRDGAITARTNGESLSVDSFLNCAAPCSKPASSVNSPTSPNF